MIQAIETAVAEHVVSTLREMIHERGGRTAGVRREQLAMLAEVCPDLDLAATAYVMEPRPEWVREVVE